MGRRSAETRERAWLEHPGAAQRVADLVGCQVEHVTEAHVEQAAGNPEQATVTVVVQRRISTRDARVLMHGTRIS